MHTFLFEEKTDHPFSRIDARIKVICGGGLLVMVLSNRAFLPSVIGAACLCLCALLRIPADGSRALFEPAFIVAVLIAIKLLSAKSRWAPSRPGGGDLFLQGWTEGGPFSWPEDNERRPSGRRAQFYDPFTRFLGALACFGSEGSHRDGAFRIPLHIPAPRRSAVIYNAQKMRLATPASGGACALSASLSPRSAQGL